jgi:hypothetical protein
MLTTGRGAIEDAWRADARKRGDQGSNVNLAA